VSHLEFRHHVRPLSPARLGPPIAVDLEDDCSGRPNFLTLVPRLRPSSAAAFLRRLPARARLRLRAALLFGVQFTRHRQASPSSVLSPMSLNLGGSSALAFISFFFPSSSSAFYDRSMQA